MALIIAFDGSGRRAIGQMEAGWPDRGPRETAFSLPEEAAAGDSVVYYVGGTTQSFVATGRIDSDWKVGRSGPWKGVQYIETSTPRRIAPFVKGSDLARQCGLAAPTKSGVVDRRLAPVVRAYLRGRPIDPVSRALEGAATESRSKQRNPKLRAAALRRAGGICAVCKTDFRRAAGGLGEHCLVVHHTVQIRDYDEPAETDLKDLVVVCANCHMMIHANANQALTIRQLRARLRNR